MRTKSLAVAAPIPLPPPVITATLPVSLLLVFTLLIALAARSGDVPDELVHAGHGPTMYRRS